MGQILLALTVPPVKDHGSMKVAPKEERGDRCLCFVVTATCSMLVLGIMISATHLLVVFTFYDSGTECVFEASERFHVMHFRIPN